MPVRSARSAVSLLVAPLLVLQMIAPACAQAHGRRTIAVPPGPLDRAMTVLARQADIDIGSAEVGLAGVTSGGVRGHLTAEAALDRLLAGTPFMARRLGSESFRIVRRPPTPTPVRRVPAHAPIPARIEASPDIVVTASKRTTSRLRFPGALTILRPDGRARFGDVAGEGLDGAIATTPILQSTALGAGRNKLFIRGVADSSFAGPTQSTANVYFGEVPVAYNGPDPGLNLYDMDRVEVLEGPQGTLYGSGAIGGIVRLVPRAVELTHVSASLSGGVSTTRSGRPGGDIAGMINLPIMSGALGVRAVGYRVVAGGYIDDVRRGLADVNGVTTTGGRFDVRMAPTSGLTIDAGLVLQNVSAPDLQYAERGTARMSRASLLAQPFEQQYLLGRVVIDRRWDDGLRLVSATGVVRRNADGRFDATRPSRPDFAIAYDTDERSRLFSHETRLSRTRANGSGWIVGMALIHARDAYARRYGPPNRLRDILGVTNRTLDAAAFGEAGFAVTSRLTITAGGRLTHQRTDGDPVGGSRSTGYIRGRSSTRLDPTLAASWLLTSNASAYARYQSGFRTGGITVAPGIGRVSDLLPDTIHVAEVGLRKERSGRTGLAGSLGASLMDWRHIQADVVDLAGFPFTTNLGDSRIRGIEANVDWVPLVGLRVETAMFLSDTRVAEPVLLVPRFVGALSPNTPPFAVSGNIGYDWSMGAAGSAGIDGGWRYVGRSVVGTQAPLDVSQGRYGTAHLDGEWTRGRLRLTATVENVFDAKGDRFAGGNPFALLARRQYTPERPRTLRIGGSIAW